MGTLQLPAKSDLEQAPALLRQLDAALDAQGLAIDASALSDFDSSTVALLLHAQRLSKARGVALAIHGAPPKLRELARLYGVDELLPLAGTA
jgi:phospholipid transport system transporter-binding protein